MSSINYKAPSRTGILLCEAIEKRQRIEFVYNKKSRIAEPQFYGFGKKGIEQLRAYQINEDPKLEKLFDVYKMEKLSLLPGNFIAPGPNYNSNDSAFIKVICKLM